MKAVFDRLLLQLLWPGPGIGRDKRRPSHSPRETAAISLRHARPVLPPSPGPDQARDRSSPRLCRSLQQVTSRERVDTAMSSHDAELGITLSAHLWHPPDAQWLQRLQIRGATGRTARCDCRIYTARCADAGAVRPSASWPILSPHSSGPVAPLACTHAYMQSFLMSVCFWLTVLSLFRPSGFPLLLLWVPLCRCHLDWSPLAACSLRGLLLPVGKCRWEDNASPGTLVPTWLCTTNGLRSPAPDGRATWQVPL